jgi:hypothetical protein
MLPLLNWFSYLDDILQHKIKPLLSLCFKVKLKNLSLKDGLTLFFKLYNSPIQTLNSFNLFVSLYVLRKNRG